MENRFNAEKALAPLKDFQRNTVEYIFDQLYISDKTDRFLVADEVGLGKTMVARGVIAKAIEHCQDTVERFDIIYICSNAAIARQNIQKLNVLENQSIVNVDRLTMMPTAVNQLNENVGHYRSKVNFISFSPNTSLNLGNSDGRWDERKLIYNMLKNLPRINRKGLKNLLRRRVARENWDTELDKKPEYDIKLAEEYYTTIKNDSVLLEEISDCTYLFRYNRNSWPSEHNNKANILVGKLRHILAGICIQALEPDLIIMDEFQRFRNILDGEDDAALLANRLFDYSDQNGKVKLLLLSATPYKMMTLNAEDEDHYQDFMTTLSFLFKHDDLKVQSINRSLRSYRHAMNSPNDSTAAAVTELREKLMEVMCRTERVNITQNHNAMLKEYIEIASVKADDFVHAICFQKVAQAVQSHNIIEYWKSSPYLLNYLKGYQLRDKVDRLIKITPEKITDIIEDSQDKIITKSQIEDYYPIEPANPRLRYLMDETIGKDMWKLLWLPPSMPYYALEGVYAGTEKLSKRIVFSCWNAVPDAVSTLLSYEAERRMVQSFRQNMQYSKLSELASLLEFRLVEEKPATMPLLAWMMPCNWLAREIDPLNITVEYDGILTQDKILEIARKKIQKKLDAIEAPTVTGSEDYLWYCAALVYFEDEEVYPFINEWKKCRSETNTGLSKHIDLSRDLKTLSLGRMPGDLAFVLAQIALAGPGTCALRALKRTVKNIDLKNAFILAADIGDGFRTLFNKPENTMLIRGETSSDDYWRQVLQYSMDGNLQSVLDEQFHLYAENIKSKDHPNNEDIKETFRPFMEALKLKTSRVQLDQFSSDSGSLSVDHFNIRCNFALRFGELKGDNGASLTRAQDVQSAFNSPFRPFVLVSTSIGQEGLDFHPWCHAVVHWNLPSNPVDLEQREGRVQRYKGLAVRKNLVQKYGLPHIRSHWKKTGDVWQWLFEQASMLKPEDSNDLIPFWIFEEGDAHIQRTIPILPYSKEVSRYDQLKDILTLYRLAFGQPRQEDLLSFLSSELSENDKHKLMEMQLVLMP